LSESATRVRPPSFLSRIVFPAFAWGLVLHSLVMAMLFGLLQVPEGTVRAIAAWKEVGLALLAMVILLRALTGRGPRSPIAWPDLWIGGLMATGVLFLLTENLWLRFNLPLGAEFMGFRDSVYFMILYFIGRGMPELATDEKTMRRLLVLVLFTCIVGILERFFVSPQMLVGLGVAAYFQDFLGVAAFTAGTDYGLPQNYWTGIGGHLVRRAGSVYLNGQGFAVPFLLFFPLVTAWVFLREKRTPLQITAFLIAALGLGLTVTRATMVVAFIQIILFVALIRRPEWAVAGLALGTAMFLAALLVVPGFPTFVWYTLSLQESSSISHATDWMNGLAALAQNPWGTGLGTTDQTALRAGLRHITGDNLYFKYGVEMGVLGLLLFVMTLASIGNAAMRLFKYGKSLAEQRLGITIWLATIGIAINGASTVAFNSITLGWLFFWLAGAAVTVSEQRADAALAAERAAMALDLNPAT
jgi:O-antigen ligase